MSISESLTGRVLSIETRKKMSAARKEWHKRNPRPKMSPEEARERRNYLRRYNKEQSHLIQPKDRKDVKEKRAERKARRAEKKRRREEYEKRVREFSIFKAELNLFFSIITDRWNP